jgi:RNA polymerase sigma-B factor
MAMHSRSLTGEAAPRTHAAVARGARPTGARGARPAGTQGIRTAELAVGASNGVRGPAGGALPVANGSAAEKTSPVSGGPSLDRFREFRRTRDKRLYQELVCAYLPLAQKIARRYLRAGVGLEDLVQIGTIGLMNAVRTFDPGRGVKFETYAFHHVAGEIRHYLRDNLEPLRVPRWVRKLHGNLTATVAQLQQELGRTPELPEIATRMNTTEDGILQILRAHNQTRVRSISDLGEDAELRQDAIAHQRYVSLQLPIEDRIVLLQAMDCLAALQRQVVYYLFYQDLTQSEVAKRLGVSQRHVSRLLAAALRRLAGPLRAAGLGPSATAS